MRKKQAFFGLVLLCATLLLGVGYAAITSVNLYINGTISAGSSIPLKVSYFVDTPVVTTKASGSKATVVADYLGEQNATIRVENLRNVNEWVAASYAIHNEGDTTAEVYLTDNNLRNSEYFKVSTGDAIRLAPGDSNVVNVEVKLIKMPSSTGDDATASVELVLQADPVNE
jgi:hypothetical protein